jgi:membrane-associated phospholipid phosphatase
VLLLVLPLKALSGRERPTKVEQVERICDMRSKEKGKSMPSGDAAAAALITGIYLFCFGTALPLLIVLPLVCLGRVYVHCHWFGDTILGSMMGITFAYLTWSPQFFCVLAMPLYHVFF